MNSPALEKELIETIEEKLLNERNRLYEINGKLPNTLIMNEYTYIILKAALLKENWERALGTEVDEWYGMKIIRLEPKQMISSLGLWFTFGSMQP